MELILSMLLMHSAPGAVPASELAPAIVQEAAKHSVDPELVAKVVLVESRGIASAASETKDLGLMQINAIHGIPESCLLDWRCNLKHGVAILAKMKRHRPCAYNVGYRYETRMKKCLQYESRLDTMSLGG